jgi:hypothetical protein
MRAVKSLLDKHPNVHRVNEKPTTYAWFDKDDRIQSAEDNKNNEGARKICTHNRLEQSCDVCDACDAQKKKGEIKNTRHLDSTHGAETVSEIPGISANTNDDIGLEKAAQSVCADLFKYLFA